MHACVCYLYYAFVCIVLCHLAFSAEYSMLGALSCALEKVCSISISSESLLYTLILVKMYKVLIRN